MSWRGETLWFINGIAIVIAAILFADAFGFLPVIHGGEESLGSKKGYGLIYFDKEASSPGYTLISPRRRNFVYLLDWQGRIVHRWTVPIFENQKTAQGIVELTKFGTLQSKLLPDGRLLVGARNMALTAGGFAALFELDWDGNVVWKYENAKEFMHHDLERLPNGRTAVIIQEELPLVLQSRLRKNAGITSGGKITADAIIEIDKDGREVWRWSAKGHLDPDEPLNHLLPSQVRAYPSWTLINAIKFVEKNPITGTPAYLVSMAQLDTVAVVERETGKIIWRGGGRGLLAGQFSADFTPEGHVIVFDNGIPEPGIPGRGIPYEAYWPTPFSRIVEIDPGKSGVGSIVFEFSPGPHVVAKSIFYTPVNGSVQALANGNILVSAGNTGRIFEIERKSGRVVWDYLSPFGLTLEEWPGVVVAPVYSSYRYPSGYAPFLK